jgi:hypothetical protein
MQGLCASPPRQPAPAPQPKKIVRRLRTVLQHAAAQAAQRPGAGPDRLGAASAGRTPRPCLHRLRAPKRLLWPAAHAERVPTPLHALARHAGGGAAQHAGTASASQATRNAHVMRPQSPAGDGCKVDAGRSPAPVCPTPGPPNSPCVLLVWAVSMQQAHRASLGHIRLPALCAAGAARSTTRSPGGAAQAERAAPGSAHA